MSKVFNVFMLATLWFLKTFTKEFSLPELYFNLARKRGIDVKTFRLLEKRVFQIVKKKLDVEYFEKCLDLKLCPEFLKFHPPKLKAYDKHNKDELYNHAVRFQLGVIKDEVLRAVELFHEVWYSVKPNLSFLERKRLIVMWNNHFKQSGKNIVEVHNKKLFALWRRQRPESPDCVMNLSSQELSITEKNALMYGLKHHILPRNVKENDLKCNVEVAVNDASRKTNIYTDSSFRDDVKFVCQSFLNKCKQVCSTRYNISMHRTLRKLANDKSIKVCKFDKGVGVCVMSSADYYDKLDTIVCDSTKFVELDMFNDQKPPWCVLEGRVQYYCNKYLKEHFKENMFVYHNIRPVGCGPGKLYGLAKVHKKDTPVRPVNSMIGSPTYELAKWLDSYIKPNVQSTYSLDSTSQFIDDLNNFPLYPGDIHVSFDVESLFTNIPLKETIERVAARLYSDHAVTTPPVTESIFKKLMKLATEGMFLYKDKLYQQIDGVAMGSPLGPTLANFFLGEIECKLLNKNSPVHPKFYKRYIDDIYCIFDSSQDYRAFHEIINSLHPNLRFTVETTEGSLPFLDVEIQLKDDHVETWIYRKSTHTGVVLNFEAIAPVKWKRGLILCLLHRAYNTCSSAELFHNEISNLRTMFLNNGYPATIFRNVLQSFLFRKRNPISANEDSDDPTCTVLLKVPYLGQFSRKFAKKLSALMEKKFAVKINIVFQTFKVGSYFSLKSATPYFYRSNVVYLFKCLRDVNSPASYVGQTTRHLAVRIDEHFSPKKGKDSAVLKHISACHQCQHCNPRDTFLRTLLYQLCS